MTRVLITFALAMLALVSTSAQTGPAAAVLRNAAGAVKFAVIGDSGTGGGPQHAIARLMAEARARFPFDFVLMMGDNMYGSETARDFLLKFEAPYRPLLAAGVRFYASLGNHDDPDQRFYAPFNMNGNRYYAFRSGDVEFFALDSTGMDRTQVGWIHEAMGRSDARWKIAYFHHPLYSSGRRHGPDLELRVVLEPLFVQYGVSVVFAGHEHFYERLKPQRGISYFTVGGSAKLRERNLDPQSPLTERGFDTDNAFLMAEVVGDQLLFETISRGGVRVDSGSVTRRAAAPTTE